VVVVVSELARARGELAGVRGELPAAADQLLGALPQSGGIGGMRLLRRVSPALERRCIGRPLGRQGPSRCPQNGARAYITTAPGGVDRTASQRPLARPHRTMRGLSKGRRAATYVTKRRKLRARSRQHEFRNPATGLRVSIPV